MKKQTKNVMISIRISKEVKKWLINNKLSPSKVFNNAIKELKRIENK
jgi:hypothetical protein